MKHAFEPSSLSAGSPETTTGFGVSQRPAKSAALLRSLLTAAIASTLALAAIAAPLLAARAPIAAFLLHSFFSGVCHQNPARSFVISGAPAAVCIRCLGIYTGAALGSLASIALGFAAGRARELRQISCCYAAPRSTRCGFSRKKAAFAAVVSGYIYRKSAVAYALAPRLFLGALLINIFDVAAETLHLHGNLPLLRFFAGILLGGAAGIVFCLRSGASPLPHLPVQVAGSEGGKRGRQHSFE
jgi:uncharacterized membrane protein